jgi:hypothetical protein
MLPKTFLTALAAKSEDRISTTRNWRRASGAWRGIMCVVIMCWMLAGSLAVGQEANELVIDSFQYATPDEAQTAWVRWFANSDDAAQPVLPATIEGVSGLTLPYEFTPDSWRGSWDKIEKLNLSDYTHLKFRVNGSAASGAKKISIAFMAGSDIWWTYNIDLADEWQTVKIPLADFKVDKNKEISLDWSEIRRIRISIIKSSVAAGSVAITDMRVVAEPAH